MFTFDVTYGDDTIPLDAVDFEALNAGIKDDLDPPENFVIKLTDGSKQYTMKSQKNFESFMKRRDPSTTHEITIIAGKAEEPAAAQEPKISEIDLSSYSYLTYYILANTDLPRHCDALRSEGKFYRD